MDRKNMKTFIFGVYIHKCNKTKILEEIRKTVKRIWRMDYNSQIIWAGDFNMKTKDLKTFSKEIGLIWWKDNLNAKTRIQMIKMKEKRSTLDYILSTNDITVFECISVNHTFDHLMIKWSINVMFTKKINLYKILRIKRIPSTKDLEILKSSTWPMERDTLVEERTTTKILIRPKVFLSRRLNEDQTRIWIKRKYLN